MTSIQTSLTKLLGIKTPIISAPMAGASGGALAAQVTLGGGFGFLAGGYVSPETLKKELSIARDLLQTSEDGVLPIGVGFIGWLLEKSPSTAEKLLSIALENRVQAVWLAFGEDLGRWVTYIRMHNLQMGSKDAVTIFVQISTVQQVLWAINECKADVIVAQGNEAGGHGLGKSLPLSTLYPLLADIVTASNGPPLVAAGGLATGAQIASFLTLGAAGVVLGTRFLLSPESLYSDSQRQALIAADSSQSVRTMAFDYARNTLGWPQGIDGRGLQNAIVDDYENGVDIDVIRERFAEGAKEGDSSRMVVWAGSGVGLMSKVMPARDILNELHEECLQHLQRAAKLIITI